MPLAGRGNAVVLPGTAFTIRTWSRCRLTLEGRTSSQARLCVICFAFFIGSPSFLVKKDPMERVRGPLSRGVMLQLLSASLQDGLRFFHPPIPATPSAPLTSGFPLRESDGLTTFRRCTRVARSGSRVFPGGASSATGDDQAPVPDHLPFGSSVQHLALVQVHDVYTCTCASAGVSDSPELTLIHQIC